MPEGIFGGLDEFKGVEVILGKVEVILGKMEVILVGGGNNFWKVEVISWSVGGVLQMWR